MATRSHKADCGPQVLLGTVKDMDEVKFRAKHVPSSPADLKG